MFEYILSLGGIVFVPIAMMLIGIGFRLSVLQAIKAGITVGIGFVGLDIVIGMTLGTLNPVINALIADFGLSLSIIDIGSGPASGVGYSTVIGSMIIPIIFVLNIALIMVKFTNTMNVDIYNYWHYAITGSLVYLMTDSLGFGIAGAMAHAIFSLKFADLTAKQVQTIVGLEGISIPQGFASSSMPVFMVMDKIYDRIPFLANRNIDAASLQKKIGIIGDPVIMGGALGLIFGLITGGSFKEVMELIIKVAALMVLFPRMIRLIVEGLLPISGAAQKYLQNRFKDRDLYIGLDSAVTLGHPTTMTVGVLLIPIMLIIASILPGNMVLPLADLPFAPFFICMATVIHRGDIVRTLLSGVVIMSIVLLIATKVAPYFTEMAVTGGVEAAASAGGAELTALAVGNPFGWFISTLLSMNVLGLIALILVIVSPYFFQMYKKRNVQVSQ